MGFPVYGSVTKASPADPDLPDSGVWTLNAEKTTFIVNSNGSGPILTLTEFSVDGTNIKGKSAGFSISPYATTITMKKK